MHMCKPKLVSGRYHPRRGSWPPPPLENISLRRGQIARRRTMTKEGLCQRKLPQKLRAGTRQLAERLYTVLRIIQTG